MADKETTKERTVDILGITDQDDLLNKKLGEVFADCDAYKITVWRLKPIGIPYEGLIDSFSSPLDEAELKELYGGGKYKATAYDKNSKYIKSVSFFISGDPKIPGENKESQSNANLTGVDTMYQNILVNTLENFKGLIEIQSSMAESQRKNDQIFFQQLQDNANLHAERMSQLLTQQHKIEMKSAKEENNLSEVIFGLYEDYKENFGEKANGFDGFIEYMKPHIGKFIPKILNSVSDNDSLKSILTEYAVKNNLLEGAKDSAND